MCLIWYMKKSNSFPLVMFVRSMCALLLVMGLALSTGTGLGQSQSQPPASPPPSQNQQSPTQGQKNQQNKPNSTPEAGGPQGDIGPIAVPKKKDEEPKKEPRPQGPKKIEGMPETSIHVNVPLVTLDVGVLSKDGMFIPGLKKENF